MNTNKQFQGTFLPDFCSARTVFVIIILAELLAILLTLSSMPTDENRLIDLALHSLFIIWVALSCTGILCIFRGKLNNLDDHWVATISYGITLIVTYIIAEISWSILSRNLGASYDYTNRWLFIFRIIAISAIVWALALRYFYVQHQWRLRTQMESEARFQALQSRIRPHFLFNCMNIIASQIRRRPAIAEQTIEDLADLFRASLQDIRTASTLNDEIDLCERYLRIEQQRLGNRLKLKWDVGKINPNIKLPVLSLQPLLENAIYHGIEPNPDGGTISFCVKPEIVYTRIIIENPLHLPLENNKRHSGNQLAQENVRQRLSTFFEQDKLLDVTHEQDLYRVTILIPNET